jgi:tRNA wybutosine-synthesizing protein 1
MIKLLRKRNIITFLVTNGQNPDAILKLEKENALPTQLTISTNAPNKELFIKWHNSAKKDAWERFNETLKIISKLKGKCRRCVRLTLVRPGKEGYEALHGLTNMTDDLVPQYVEMINKAQPNFVHIKGYTSIGHARARMGYDKMPWFNEIMDYSKKILNELKKTDKSSNSSSSISPGGEWKILGHEERSCIVVLGKTKKGMKIKKA